MFLWVTLALGMLERARGLTTKRLKALAASLPPGLNDLYRSSLDKIDREFQDEEDKNMVQKILTWVVLAERPLTLYELREALAIEKGTSELEEDNIMRNIRDVQGICGAFIEIVPAGAEEDDEEEGEKGTEEGKDEKDGAEQNAQNDADSDENKESNDTAGEDEEDKNEEGEEEDEEEISEDEEEEEEEEEGLADTVRLIHQSAKEFLLGEFSNNRINRQDGQTYIAEMCLTYLLYDVFDCDIIDTETNAKDMRHMKRKALKHKFLSYGSYHVDDHVRAATGNTFDADSDIGKMLLCLFCDAQQNLDNWRQAVTYFGDNTVNCTRGQLPLQTAILFQLIPFAKYLISSGRVDINTRDGGGDAPIHSLIGTIEIEMSTKMELYKVFHENGMDINIQRKDGSTPFMLAVHHDLETTKVMLEFGADIYISDDRMYGPTGVHEAAECSSGHLEVLKYLIEERGVDVNLKTRYRAYQTLLNSAIRQGTTVTAEYLIKRGADLEIAEDVRDEDFRPLHIAASLGHKDILLCLLDHGANIEGLAADNETPLLAAVRFKQDDCVKILLERGAVPEVRYPDEKGGLSALITACGEEDGLNIVKMLVEAGADVNYATKPQIDAAGGEWTPLNYAAPSKEIMKHLLDAGANVNQANSRGWTIFHRVAIETGCVSSAKQLLAYGADPKVRDCYGNTALHLAASYGWLDMVKFLVNTVKLDVNALTDCDETPLSIAIHKSAKEVEGFLRAAGATETNSQLERRNRLQSAVRDGNLEQLKALVNNEHIPIDLVKRVCTDSNCGPLFCGSPPIHIAAELGHTEVVRFLLEKGADINSLNPYERETPLHCAIRSGNIDTVKVLLEAGSDPNKPDEILKRPPIHTLSLIHI